MKGSRWNSAAVTNTKDLKVVWKKVKCMWMEGGICVSKSWFTWENRKQWLKVIDSRTVCPWAYAVSHDRIEWISALSFTVDVSPSSSIVNIKRRFRYLLYFLSFPCSTEYPRDSRRFGPSLEVDGTLQLPRQYSTYCRYVVNTYWEHKLDAVWSIVYPFVEESFECVTWLVFSRTDSQRDRAWKRTRQKRKICDRKRRSKGRMKKYIYDSRRLVCAETFPARRTFRSRAMESKNLSPVSNISLDFTLHLYTDSQAIMCLEESPFGIPDSHWFTDPFRNFRFILLDHEDTLSFGATATLSSYDLRSFQYYWNISWEALRLVHAASWEYRSVAIRKDIRQTGKI